MNELECPSIECYRAWAEIDLGAVAFNVKQLQEVLGNNTQIMAVVKADGYGHGAEQISKTALASGATWLGVATTDEGIALRKCGIRAPILILAPIPVERIKDAICNDLRLTVCTVDMLQAISQAAQAVGKNVRVHVKIDTGMGRIGILPGEAGPFIRTAMTYPNITVEGIFTHFACADDEDKTFTVQQFECFCNVMEEIKGAGLSSYICHASNSAAVLAHPTCCLDMVRAGIIIYGLYPSSTLKDRIPLRPSLEFKTRVIHVKKVPAGTRISYGGTYSTDEPCAIVTLAVGYADGFSRSLSNKGVVLIGGRRLPVVGRVCMDQCMVKAPIDSDIAIGDEAVLIGRQGDEEITADEVASLMGTINYEVVCMITGRVPRVYKNGSVTE